MACIWCKETITSLHQYATCGSNILFLSKWHDPPQLSYSTSVWFWNVGFYTALCTLTNNNLRADWSNWRMTFDCLTEDEAKNTDWSVSCGFDIIKSAGAVKSIGDASANLRAVSLEGAFHVVRAASEEQNLI